jgi:hypothetical protein
MNMALYPIQLILREIVLLSTIMSPGVVKG